MDQHDLSWAIDQALQEHERRTRRDRFIAAVLAGAFSDPTIPINWTYERYAKMAIEAVYAVIAELEKGQT